MLEKWGLGIAFTIVGVIFIVRALTAEHLYNDVDGPIPQEQIHKARPRERLFGVCLGLFCIAIGLFSILHP
jgi:hypothetical protein